MACQRGHDAVEDVFLTDHNRVKTSEILGGFQYFLDDGSAGGDDVGTSGVDHRVVLAFLHAQSLDLRDGGAQVVEGEA